MNIEFLPWQQGAAKALFGGMDRLSHACLILGRPGIGQLHFAQALAASLLCERAQGGGACGACPACSWVSSGNHPDLHLIRPEAVAQQEDPESFAGSAKEGKLSNEIKVDQIRAILPWVSTSTHRGGWRVALIYPAEAINEIATNAILKILEEPPAQTVFLLVANSAQSLLPTLVSRCRKLVLPQPEIAQAQCWLEEKGLDHASERLAAAGGAPILALENAAGAPIAPELVLYLDTLLAGAQGTAQNKFADALQNRPTLQWLDAFQRLCLDMSLVALDQKAHFYPGLQARLQSLRARLDSRRLTELGKWLAQQRDFAGHPLSPKLLADYAAQILLQAVPKTGPKPN